MHSPIPLTQDVVLVGGGHAHALFLRKWAMKPLAGARLTLINPDPAAPYTGMLPGFVAGHYPRDALMIDLVRLARSAGARLILGRVTEMDLPAKTLTVPGRPPIRYDIASIDIGITSDLPSLPGFSDHAVPAKPLGRFADRWDALVANPPAAPNVVILGGGVGGVELAMAAAHRLGRTATITIVEASSEILSILPARTRRYMLEAVDALGITVLTHTRAREVTETLVRLDNGSNLPADLVIGATGARPQDWLATTGLSLHDGFIEVDHWLRTIKDPTVFAVGDCAHLGFAPRPKAGVYAVRQAKILHHNIRADLTGSHRKLYHPQRDYLKLISTGRKAAVLDRSGIALKGDCVWRLKDRIDRAFMDQFEALQPMAPQKLPAQVARGVRAEIAGKPPLCGGCGAKVDATTLDAALATLPHPRREDVVSQIGDDAALLNIAGTTQVITTDHLRAVVEDPFLMTRIAVNHALGDIWAMGARPQVALAQIILPRARTEMHAAMLAEITRAAEEVLAQVGAELAGGHTSIGAELTIGFTVTGLTGSRPIGLAGAKPGDKLVLTRPLGSGVLFATDMQARARGEDVSALWQILSSPQQETAVALAQVAHAMTDVTGFGLAGHLRRLCAASGVGAELREDAIPVFAGALEAVRSGIASSLYAQNRSGVPDLPDTTPTAKILFDPQTAGGLLAAVPSDAHVTGATQIGVITEEPRLRLVS
ncbi:selenide, water dikinase SelD [Tropicimonas sp. S265A]|uniref:selenide, water dikinase SelD n=1 Tax=Tropicimonas sp. S265A TaxID=3415134 RepID=UPI003C7D621C